MGQEPLSQPDAEAVVCRALLLTPGARAYILDRVQVGDFTGADTLGMYRYLALAWEDGRPLDSPDIQAELLACEGWHALVKSASTLPWPAAVEQVISASIRRKVCRAALQAHASAADPSVPLADARREWDALIDAAADTRAAEVMPTRKDCMSRMIDLITTAREGRGLTWGISDLNLVSLSPGRMIVVAARPRHGKTALGISCLYQQAKAGFPVGMICCEMTVAELTARIVSHESGVPAKTILDGMPGASPADWAAMKEAGQRAIGHPWHLYGGKVLDMAGVKSIAQHWVKREGVKLIYVDYLQKLRHARGDSLRERVSGTSAALKDLALSLKVPLVVFAQLSREAENRVPCIEHLKETSCIEEDADAVILLDRPEVNEPNVNKRGYEDAAGELTRYAGVAAALVVKQRNGPQGDVLLRYHAPTMQFAAYGGKQRQTP